MDAVAVGGLDQQIIGLCERRRVFEDGLVGAAEIARKEDRAALAVAADIDFDDCGTENMPGGVKRRFDAVADGDDLFELDGTELRKTGLSVLNGIKRLDGTRPLAAFFFVGILDCDF